MARSRRSDSSHSWTNSGPCVSNQAQKRAFGRPSTVMLLAATAGAEAMTPPRTVRGLAARNTAAMATNKTNKPPKDAEYTFPRRRRSVFNGARASIPLSLKSRALLFHIQALIGNYERTARDTLGSWRLPQQRW